MDKTVIIYDMGKSDWDSVQVIKSNLVEAYIREEKNQVIQSSLSPKSTGEDLWNTYSSIVKNQPSRIVFVDGVPHPRLLLTLFKKEDFKKLPEIIFHIYGDFTLKTNDWSQCETILKNYKVLFLCASDKQVDLMKKFINKADKLVKKCPFAIDTKSYFNSKELRLESRKSLKLTENEFMLIYTGRLSYQKNIHYLLSFFTQLKKLFNLKAKLYIVGDFDDIGAPFIGMHLNHARYFNDIMNIYDFLSPETRESIVFTGKLETSELNKMYNAADLFISFSVHNDEDFGMSPIEALATGTPAVLSDWGGYKSFESKYCKLVETKILNDQIKINYKSAIKSAITMLNKKLNRDDISKQYTELFSIDNVKIILKEVLKTQKFAGFSDDFYELNKTFKECQHSPLSVKDSHRPVLYSELYKRLYSSYES